MTNNKPSIKKRIKHYTPEILVGASVVAGAVGILYLRKEIKTPISMAAAFHAHASDASVEIIAGGEDAFVVLTKEAAARLMDEGSIALANGCDLIVSIANA